MRINSPLMIRQRGKEYKLTEEGKLLRCNGNEQYEKENIHYVDRCELMETMEYIAGYSLYAYEDELRQGFLTIQGGHRVGVAGKILMEEGKVRSIRYISFLNIRLAHQVEGCADKVMPFIVENGEVCHTLIISPPCCGKTTLLRDVIRQISNGNAWCEGKNVGVVDERSEIGGAYQGVPQNDLGIRTDLLDCCPKAEGMMMLIRSMSPEVVAVDEIGDYGDIKAIESVLNCGCRLIATVHGSSVEDIEKKPLLQKMVKEHVFDRYIILSGKKKIGSVWGIFDGRGTGSTGRRGWYAETVWGRPYNVQLFCGRMPDLCGNEKENSHIGRAASHDGYAFGGNWLCEYDAG